MAIWDKVKKKVEEAEVNTTPKIQNVEPIKYVEEKKSVNVMPGKEEAEIQMQHIDKQLETLVNEMETLDKEINKLLVLKKMYEYALAYHNNQRVFTLKNTSEHETG